MSTSIDFGNFGLHDDRIFFDRIEKSVTHDHAKLIVDHASLIIESAVFTVDRKMLAVDRKMINVDRKNARQ